MVRQFPNLKRCDGNTNQLHDWRYLLLCASLLSQSEAEKCQDIALRIAQFCLECEDTSDDEKDAAAVVLDSMANRPAIGLAERRNLLHADFVERLPFPLFQDWTKRSLEYSVNLSDSTSIQVNRFQRRFWDDASANDWMSVSAPTSAGKSFIVERWLAEYLRTKPLAKIVFLVPTRALIQQVQRDVDNLLKNERIPNVAVTTLPLRSTVVNNKACIFVFTQERFHILLGEVDADLSFDLLIVDEAQKIGDNYRGVLLQQAIEAAVLRSPACRVFFASPMTDNPETMLADAPRGISSKSLVSEDTMVNQNLIWTSQEIGRPSHWNLELLLDSTPIFIGSFVLPASPSPESKRLPFVAFSLGNHHGGNVVYVNGAAEAEKVAMQLYDLVEAQNDLSTDDEISALIELIRRIVHPKYSLANVLQRGIAFHYGNMPLLIRTEIERLFDSNKLKYLVCTSTLIEGINMPCQSIFVRGPQKGRGIPMAPSDFWNLAGRAGRWGKEFQGNIVCVDATKDNLWKLSAPRSRTKFHITRTSDQILRKSEELVAFIDNRTPRGEAVQKPNLEYVFSYLVCSYINHGSIAQTIWAQRFDDRIIKTLDQKVGAIVDKLKVPKTVVLKNPGISAIAMDGLLAYFDEHTGKRQEPLDQLMPVPAESEDAFESYVKILNRINSHLAPVFGRGGRVRQLALLIVHWLRGFPLAMIISGREQYYRNHRTQDITLSNLIRETMKDVEEIARFQAPKYLGCYVDLLREHLELNNRHDLIERLIEINILLEFGVSQTTQLSLIGLGLSRSSAIALSEFITDDSLQESQCLSWLKESDWITRDLPALVKREIADVLQNKEEES